MSFVMTSAAVMAATAHAGQTRKELGQPYINHPLRVGHAAATLGMSAEFIAACYLHDVVEDTNTPIETIDKLFPAHTARLVRLATKWWTSGDPDEDSKKAAYYDALIAYPGGALLKVLDRTDNLHDFAQVAMLTHSGHAWAARYLKKTLVEFPRLLRHAEVFGGARAVRDYHAAVAQLASIVNGGQA